MDEFEEWCAEMGASGAVNCFIPSREDLRKAFVFGLAKGRKEGMEEAVGKVDELAFVVVTKTSPIEGKIASVAKTVEMLYGLSDAIRQAAQGGEGGE